MKQLIISVHGIRTFGGWQERLERLLLAEGAGRELTVINYKFGYFSVLAFVIPFLRWLVVRRFRNFFVDAAKSQQWDRIDLVGHSFGTHIIAWALYGIDSAARPPVNTIILAGSVLKSGFPWQVLIGHSVKRVVNDCGTRDAILVFNQIAILFTGMAGRLGFNGGMGKTFRNRFFDCGHSGYFLTAGVPDDEFMRRYWVPLLVSDDEPKLVDMRQADALSGIKLWLLNNAEPIKLVVYLSPLIALVWYLNALNNRAEIEKKNAVTEKKNAEIQLHRANANFDISHKLLSDYLETVSETVKLFAQVETLDALLNKTIDLMKTVPQGDDRRILLERARASIILAEIKWERGKVKEMYDLANEATLTLAKLPNDIPEGQRLEAQHLSARGTGLIGLFYSASTTEADPKKALDNSKKAISQLEQLEKKFDETKPSGTEWRWLRSLARLQNDMGDLLLSKYGHVEEASQYYKKSIETWKKLRGAQPNNVEIDFELAWAINKFGDVLRDQGNDGLALSRFEEAAENIRRLGDYELSTHLRWREALSIVKNNIGLVLRRQRQYERAIASFQEAKAEINKALDHDRGHRNWLSVLAWTNDNLGETRVRWARAEKDASRLTGAEDELKQAHQSRLDLAQAGVNRWRLAAHISEANIAALSGTQKELMRRCIGAARDFQNAAMINPEATGDEGDDDMVLRTAEFRKWAALSFRNAGRRDEAERELKEALATISRYTPKFIAKRAMFAAATERLEKELREGTQPEPGACID